MKTGEKLLWNPMVALIKADTPESIKAIEKIVERTQADIVDHFIENSCWGRDLPEFVGGRGTPEERLAALRFAMSLSSANVVVSRRVQ